MRFSIKIGSLVIRQLMTAEDAGVTNPNKRVSSIAPIYEGTSQGSKCPSLPGFTHGFYPGKPGLGFKPYFENVGT